MESTSSAQHEENIAQLKKDKKRKATTIPFEVVRVLENLRKGRYSLKAVKPLSKVNVDACSTVCLKEERAENERAFHIMHKNILSLKLLDKNKLQINDPLAVAAFVEPYDGTLWSICGANDCADKLRHIPSPTFQRYLRQIVSGLDFLIKSDLYHGNLSWDSTLYQGDIIKLAGFKLKVMNDNEAKWHDWLCFIKMLEDVLERAHQLNSSSHGSKFYCGTLESLIGMMKTLDYTSLPVIKEIILQDPFFWDSTKRVNFFAMTVSLKLSDVDFMNRVRNSGICKNSWDKNCRPHFERLVTKMNDHREAEGRKSMQNRCRGGRGAVGGGKTGKPYDGNSVEHYVKCICGAYTHMKQIGVDVDHIVHENHPSICIDVKRIVDAADDLVA